MSDLTTNGSVLVTGAAGFIGSHLVDRLLEMGAAVVGIDNFSRGTHENITAALTHPAFRFFEADITDLSQLQNIISQFKLDFVWHLAANSDIVAGVSDPSVDLRDTFLTTFNTLSVMRAAGIRKLAFSSTSAVYGVHPGILTENTGPLFPISNYGAMKLGSEGLISAAVESFLERAWIFRFPNVVGSRATHGIIFDLLTKLSKKPVDMEVLGDGTQQKPYLHVSELIDSMLLITNNASEPLNCFNIGPADEGTTVRRIAETVIRVAAPAKPIRFTGGKKGWVGDVPAFQYSIDKLKGLGWAPQLSSEQAVLRAAEEIHQEFRRRQ